MEFKFDSAFWVFNLVSNYAYSRYYIIYPEVLQKIIEKQNGYFKEIDSIDKKALSEYSNGNKDKAIEILTEYSTSTADQLVGDWLEFFQSLFADIWMDTRRQRILPIKTQLLKIQVITLLGSREL